MKVRRLKAGGRIHMKDMKEKTAIINIDEQAFGAVADNTPMAHPVHLITSISHKFAEAERPSPTIVRSEWFSGEASMYTIFKTSL
jgi:hypothetical protein